MPEDLQTKTVDGSAAFQRGSQEDMERTFFRRRPRGCRGDLDPMDPNYVEPPDDPED